jgi:hypothetical protein
LAKFFKCLARVAAAVGLILPVLADAGGLSDRIDSLSNSIDGIEDKVQSTLMSGGSAPVSFSGEARLKMQYHDLGFDAPGYMQGDRSYLQSGWEGNENLFRLGMIVSPGRNTILYAKLGFQHTLMGNRSYLDYAEDGGYVPYQYRHDKSHASISIHEDLSAGIAVRTVPASFWVRLGNTMWTEASPLTVWKAQPRTFAWEYLPFEVEQPIARYYEYNIAKGEKSGRAAWNKKPFNGINFESINLPLDFYVNLIYGTYERFDNFEREYVDYAGDVAYGDGALGPFPFKAHGVGDSYRHVFHGRVAKAKLFNDMTLGLNYVGINYKDDAIYANKEGVGNGLGSGSYSYLMEFRGNDSIFFKEPKTLSLDLRGPVSQQFSIHADVAINWTDTMWLVDSDPYRRDANGNILEDANGNRSLKTNGDRANHPEWYNDKSYSGGLGNGLDGINPAVYTKIGYTGFLPVEVDLAYIHPGFYSPFSFATPIDAFYAFGSNMVGAGKFIARGEGSPYTQNMAGASVTFAPKIPGYGHVRIKYGQHFNVNEEGRDLLFFPYRLNGADMFSFFHSSYNRWGNGLIDNSVKARSATYTARLGDESFWHMSSYNTNNLSPSGGQELRAVAGPGAGGLRSDYLSMFEGFVPYENSTQAYLNWKSKLPFDAGAGYSPYYPDTLGNYSTITNQTFVDGNDTTNTSWVPVSRKHTFNLEFDAAYDIGGFIGYKKDLFVGGYFGINGITKTPSVLEYNDKGDNTLLMSYYLRLEPAIALNKNFYLLGLFGLENWRSQKSWMMINLDGTPINPVAVSSNNTSISPDNFVRVPINYWDKAYGVGFDWDMLERVGLHGRVKWISHNDQGYNDWLNGYHREKYARDLKEIDDYNREHPDRVRPPQPYQEPVTGQNDWGTWVVSLEIKTWF